MAVRGNSSADHDVRDGDPYGFGFCPAEELRDDPLPTRVMQESFQPLLRRRSMKSLCERSPRGKEHRQDACPLAAEEFGACFAKPMTLRIAFHVPDHALAFGRIPALVIASCTV